MPPVYLLALVHTPPPQVLPADNIEQVINLPDEGYNLGSLFGAQEDHDLENEAIDEPEGVNKSTSASETQDADEVENLIEAQGL